MEYWCLQKHATRFIEVTTAMMNDAGHRVIKSLDDRAAEAARLREFAARAARPESGRRSRAVRDIVTGSPSRSYSSSWYSMSCGSFWPRGQLQPAHFLLR